MTRRALLDVARLLRDYRLRARLSQQQLAEVSSVSVRTIRAIEAGRAQSARRSTARLLADALRLSKDDRAAFEIAACGEMPVEMLRDALDWDQIAPQASTNPLIGRDNEVEELIYRLNSQMNQLIVVNGLEGIGKSHLVLEVIQQLRHRRGTPCLWVPLAESELSPPHASKAADYLSGQLRELLVGNSASDKLTMDGLIELLSSSEVVIVLDGIRHTFDRSDTITELLAACPRLRVVATARSPEALPSDFPFSLGPLVASDNVKDYVCNETMPENSSGRLFCYYLLQSVPNIVECSNCASHIASICRHLDGIPAALKLAAQWAAVHSLPALDGIICHNPFALRTPTSDGKDGFNLYDALSRGISQSSSDERRILVAAHDRYWWTVQDMATWVRADIDAVTEHIYQLFARGLLRRSMRNQEVYFATLSVIGAAMRHSPATLDNVP